MKKSAITIFRHRKCKACGQSVEYEVFSQMYLKLFRTHNKVENFLNTIDKNREYIFNKGFDLNKYWKNPRNNIYCSDCLHDFYEAIHYPRQCFECHRPLSFMEAVSSQYNQTLTQEEVLLYWLDPVIEFLCCSCFKKLLKILKIENGFQSC